MKHLYRVTRPMWADLKGSETLIITTAAAAVALYAVFGEHLIGWLLAAAAKPFGLTLAEETRLKIGNFVDVIAVPILIVVLLHWYRRLRVTRFYPSTFLYFFDMPKESNPNGKSKWVGYCCLDPEMESGEISAHGASFDWEDGRLPEDSRVRFKSTLVFGKQKKNGTTICTIEYNIDPRDADKRTYHHGILEFSPLKESITGREPYVGFLQSTNREGTRTEVKLSAKGYAELMCRRLLDEQDEPEIRTALREKGEQMFHDFEYLQNRPSLPELWDRKEDHSDRNIWQHSYPSPQSVLLSESLRVYVDKVFDTILDLNGFTDQEINCFKKTAREIARKEPANLKNCEFRLKNALTNVQNKTRMDVALEERAKIIYDEVAPYVIGESLLDVGCGNGLVANLLRKHFRGKVLVTDIKNYLFPGLHLRFKPYSEGSRLPCDRSEQFDTVLLIAVLHHATNPRELLRLAWAATRQRLIIIESVIGVRERHNDVQYDLVDSSLEDQTGYAVFIDWFYNRVLHDDVQVPYNFTTPERWKEVFDDEKMDLKHTQFLGQDIKIGPEYHVLFVLERAAARQETPGGEAAIVAGSNP